MLDDLLLIEKIKQGADVVIDSRKVTKGSIFFGLNGEHHRGSTFANKAFALGAEFAVLEETPSDLLDVHKSKILIVEDSLLHLQELAKLYRQHISAKIIGVTGSNGKTTTKELIRDVLSKEYMVYATPGNYNNHIGVPLTLFGVKPQHEFLVCEMGANHQGEIAYLSELAQPHFGMITNIGKAHLEGFGGVIGIKKGKSELYRYLDSHMGLIFVDGSDDVLMTLISDDSSVLEYDSRELQVVENDEDHLSFIYEDVHVHTHLVGAINIKNIAAALAIGDFFEVPLESRIGAISEYIPSNNRSQLEPYKTGQIVFDCYNSNPTSLNNTLDHFIGKYPEERLVFVLGDMLELGPDSLPEHQSIVDKLKGLQKSKVIFVGHEFGKCQIDNEEHRHFESVENAREVFSSFDASNKVFILKGSRSIGIERIIE